MFQNKTMCRLPSFPFAVVSLLQNHGSNESSDNLPQIDPSSVGYVLDTDSNLSGTRGRLDPFLKSMSENNNWAWDGVVGRPPSENFMVDVLTRDRGLFVYCGHGGGEKLFSRSCIENLNKLATCAGSQKSSRRCESCVILMGCSSAKLNSVNATKYDQCRGETMHNEPEGIALSYLVSGAPCVIGNLWDVTDRDIDR